MSLEAGGIGISWCHSFLYVTNSLAPEVCGLLKKMITDMRFVTHVDQVSNISLLLTSCLSLDKPLNVSELQFVAL